MAECSTQPNGSGTVQDPYVITDVCELNWIRNALSAYYVVANDIDASDTENWNSGQGFDHIGSYPSSPFTGNIDGNKYAINGLYINRPSNNYSAFIAYSTSSVIKNLKFKNSYIAGKAYTATLIGRGSVTASYVRVINGEVRAYNGAGLLDTGGGNIQHCSFEGQIIGINGEGYVGAYRLAGLINHIASYSCTMKYCFANVTMTNTIGDYLTRYFGGLIGAIYGFTTCTIQECYSKGSIYLHYSGDWWNPTHVGGLIASAGAGSNIKDNYSRVNISYSGYGPSGSGGGLIGQRWNVTIDNCYSTGVVSWFQNAGGLIGQNAGGGTVTDSFWDKETSGQATSAGGTGKTTAEMKTKATFTDAGWNFTDIWKINALVNGGYPCFLGENNFLGFFVRGNEIQAIFDGGNGVRSPDFGDTWYAMHGLPSDAVDVGFDVNNPQNSFVGCAGMLYVFDHVSGGDYYYVAGASIEGTTSGVDVDLHSDVGVIGTSTAVYKTLDWGHTVYKWLNQPAGPGVAFGGYSLASGES